MIGTDTSGHTTNGHVPAEQVAAIAELERAKLHGGGDEDVRQLREGDTSEYQAKLHSDVQWEKHRQRVRDRARAELDAEQSRSGTRFAERMLTRSALTSLTPLEPLIADTLELGTDAMLAGPYGSCKSFVALSWAASVATGHPWHDRKVARAGPVVYVAGEGASGVGPRLAAWEEATGVPIGDEALLTLPAPVNLSRPVEVDEFIAVIRGRRPVLVIFETLNRCAVGADENSATEMGKVVDSMRRVREATADGVGTTLVVHHTGKDGKVRGSSGLPAAMDTVYQTDGSAALVRLTRTKRKDGEAADDLALSLRRVGPSGVLDLVHSPGRSVSAQDQLLSAFLSAFSETGCSRAELRKIAELPSATFHRALNALVSAGDLVNIGTEQRPHYRRAGGR